MASIFISYKRQDSTRVASLVRLLEDAGYSVWWDQGIEPGDDWFDTILEELERSSLTLGVWSQASIDARGAFVRNSDGKSSYVKIEHEKTGNGRLIPLLLDEGRIAIEYSHLQFVDLIGWNGERHDTRCARLMERVGALLGESTNPSRLPGGERDLTPILPAKSHGEPRPKISDSPLLPDLVIVPPGRFEMGSPPFEKGRFENEGPTKEVAVERRVAIARTPTTRAQWEQFVQDSGYMAKKERGIGLFVWDDRLRRWTFDANRDWRTPNFDQGDDHPVVGVSYDDVLNYCTWATKISGFQYRPLTEVEWEYACRAGTKTAYSVGHHIFRRNANFDGRYLFGNGQRETQTAGGKLFEGGTLPVRTYAANGFGLHDLHGNVWEWATAVGTVSSAQILRGGSWVDHLRRLRSASRLPCPRTNRSAAVGFRVCRIG